MQLIQIRVREEAQKASDFLATSKAFSDSKDWNKQEVDQLVNAPLQALKRDDYYAWVMLEGDVVIGYIDLRAHDLHNGGYYTDWFAVHEAYRSKGIGGEMLEYVENFARDLTGRYILIETGDIDVYVRTRKFYENHGYKQVGYIPEYYYKNWGMYIYQKLL